MNSESRSQHANQCLQSSERGLLRRQVNEFEETTSNKKRKASEMTPATNLGQVSTSVGTRPLKRSYAFHEGLTKNWRAQISHSKYLESGSGQSFDDIFLKVLKNTLATP